jgi:chemotaxis protein MotB
MKYLYFLALGMGLISCVSQKKYDALVEDKMALENLANSKDAENKQLQTSIDSLNVSVGKMVEDHNSLTNQYTRLQSEKDYLAKQLKDVNDTFNALINANNGTLERKAKEAKDLLAELNKREQKLKELERLIAAKDKQMKGIKAKLLNALNQYQGKGIEIKSKDGKIYISLDNSLLFASGKWELNQKALHAINQLGKVLASEKSLQVLIEGHTDNIPYNHAVLEDNWDLSVKRATSVVRQLLKTNNISPSRITAAGRSKYNPILTNSSKEGRAKNRRIEIIILPDLSDIEKILK